MTTYTVSSGHVFTTDIGPADVVSVLSGGVTSGIQNGGHEFVSLGGSSFGDTIIAGGVLSLAAGAVVSGDTVAHGGELVGSVGFSGDGGLVGSVFAYGTVSETRVGDSGYGSGTLFVESGGAASSVTFGPYGSGEVLSGGTAVSATLQGPYASLQVDAGGSAVDTTLLNPNGTSGFFVNKGFASGTVVSSKAIEFTGSGGSSLADAISAGGSAVVSSGALTSGATVFSGGTISLLSGATVEDVTVSSGGSAYVQPTISKGVTSTLDFRSALTTSTIDGVTFESGANLTLLDPIVLAGGVLSTSQAALVDGATISRGGVLTGDGRIQGGAAFDYGLVSGMKVRLATLTVESGGVARDVTFNAFARGMVLSGGRAVSVTLSSARELGFFVSAGGSAIGTTVLGVTGGGIVNNGVTRGTVIGSRGSETTLAAGSSLDEKIEKGGSALVLGLASGATISSGGVLWLYSGGTASGLRIQSGGIFVDDGTYFVEGGRLALPEGDGVIENTSGALKIQSGSDFAGGVQIDAGSVTLAGGIPREVVFAATTSAAQLVIAGADRPAPGGAFSSEIVDFSSGDDSVDLVGVTYAAGATTSVVTGNGFSTLVLTDGGKTYDFTLGGSIAPSYVVTQDGTGTLITADPPSAGAAQLAQAMATFGVEGGPAGPATGSGIGSSSHALIAEPEATHPNVGRPL